MADVNRRIVEPAKLGLAIAIIYAIAFYMGWDKPYWATVSAVSVNLLSSGLTLHRGIIRTLGTALGGFAGMALIGMFPQERWAYMVGASIVLFFLGYLATGKKEPYLFLIILITFIVVMAGVQQAGYTDSGAAFEVVRLRVTQTWMGSVVMILVMVYIFPYRTVGEFEGVCRMRWGIQRKLYNAYRGMLFGQEEAEGAKHLRMEDAPLLDFAHFKLHGAEQDSFEMLHWAHDWHHYLDQTAQQYEIMESLRQGLSDLKGLDLSQYVTNLEALASEFDRRFEQTDRMLGKEAPSEIPRHMSVELDEEATRALPHFQEAAVRVIKADLERLEEVSLALYDGVAKIRMFERAAGAHDHHHGHGHGGHGFSFDPFRLRATLAFVAAVWVAYFIWIYVYDIPRGSLFTCFVVITGSIAAYRPEMNHLVYGAGWLIGGLAAGPFYVLLMHQVTDFLSLSIMVVSGVFILQYALYPFFHPVARIFVTIGFTIVLDAEAHQHYSMQHYMQTLLWMACAIAVSLALRFAFIPRRPDVRFIMVLDQFFRHADFLLSAQDAEGKPDRSLKRRLLSYFYGYSLLADAERLALFGGQLDPHTAQTTYRSIRGATPEQVQELVRYVYALAHRIEALVEAREAWQSNTVDQHVMDEKREWHQVMQDWFRRPLGTEMAEGPNGDLPARLAKLETRIEEAFDRIDEGELSAEDYENFYRRLGNYRGLSEAAAGYARVASQFDWPRWQETRF